MSPYNKHKFLDELGRLLTFMSEDDRIHVLELYNEIFEDVGNENVALQRLVSPTRQAVNLARAYQKPEHHIQDDIGVLPEYLPVIKEIHQNATVEFGEFGVGRRTKRRMPFQIRQANILCFLGDAIIIPTDEQLSGNCGLDQKVHKKAGTNFLLECKTKSLLNPGDSVITTGGQLLCRYVIHTAVPQWTGKAHEIEQLRLCYRNSLKLAAHNGLETIALPLIGAESSYFPDELVLRIAIEEIGAFLATHEDIYILLVIQNMSSYKPDHSLVTDLERYLFSVRAREMQSQNQDSKMEVLSQSISPVSSVEDCLREWAIKSAEHEASESKSPYDDYDERSPIEKRYYCDDQLVFPEASALKEENQKPGYDEQPKNKPIASHAFVAAEAPESAHKEIGHHPSPASPVEKAKKPYGAVQYPIFPGFMPERGVVLDEGFSQMLFRKIDERGFKKDSDCYKKANIDKRLFAKIKKDPHYHPSKTTALAFAIALELSVDETNELLLKAGYGLSHSIMSDVIVEYFILQRNYNIFAINEMLFKYDQALLGG